MEENEKILNKTKFMSTYPLKWYITNIIALFGLIGIYKLSEYLLLISGLAFRSVVVYSVGAAVYILSIVFLFRLARLLYKFAANKSFKHLRRVVSGIGSAVISLIIAAVLALSVFYGPLLLVFSYHPEHVVEKEGKKMVAYVYSFLDVSVEYYDYKNPFVRGSRIRIDEYWGSGGYNPFEEGRTPSVKSATYYDENGKVVKAFGR